MSYLCDEECILLQTITSGILEYFSVKVNSTFFSLMSTIMCEEMPILK